MTFQLEENHQDILVGGKTFRLEQMGERVSQGPYQCGSKAQISINTQDFFMWTLEVLSKAKSSGSLLNSLCKCGNDHAIQVILKPWH